MVAQPRLLEFYSSVRFTPSHFGLCSDSLVEHLTCKQKVVGSNPTLGRYFSTQVYLNGDEEIWSQVFGGFRGS